MALEDSEGGSLLAELRELDAFRRRYSSEAAPTPIDALDPDVQRLIEALAYSAVRTRRAVLHNLNETWRRLLGGYFQPLLRPLPAMAMLEAQITARMTETVELPAGTELRVTMADGFVASFRTLCDLRIVPMTLERCDTLRGSAGYRLVLTFVSRIPRADAVGVLRLYLHYLDDYLAALSVHQQLARHLQRAFVVYDAPIHERSDGPTCEVRFGRSPDEPYEADEQNPLSAVRSFFHFPEQELLVNVTVPPPQRPWTRLSLCFDLDADWPRTPPVYREIFRPFAVPVENLRRAPAQPLDCDGTQDAYPIQLAYADPSYSLHGVTGVFRIIASGGLEPVQAAAISKNAAGYEVEYGSEGDTPAALLLRSPRALLNPLRVVVEGTWQQPGINEHLGGRMSVTLPDRSLLGLELAIVGPVRRALPVQLGRDSDALLRLLSLKMKSLLDLGELTALFAMLETTEHGPYRGFLARIKELRIEITPDETLRGSGIRHAYHLLVPRPKREEEPLWNMFCQQLQRLLDAWDYEGRAEVIRHTDPSELPGERLWRT